jgi:hypothetical protein
LLETSDRGGNVSTLVFLNASNAVINDGVVKEAKPVWDETTNLTYQHFLQSDCNFEVGDILIYRGEAISGDEENEYYQLTVEVTIVYSPSSIEVKYLATTLVPDITNFEWSVELQQKESPFEKIFPRFAYRWKYEDNQFSSFSPFTVPAFLAFNFNYNAKTGYNKGMINKARKIVLFDPSLYADAAGFAAKVTDYIPVDVTKIEILYKETNNSAVYVVDEINVEDLVFNTWQGFKITEKLIHKITQSNQLLRPWDNVPRKAKAQEIVGNRLIYGNYLQNYTLNSDIKIAASKFRGPARQIRSNAKSIKTDRSYQVGVVFRDEYGRETPVFTSSDAVVRFERTDAEYENKIKVQSLLSAPSGFTEFKYFIKDTAGQYYNLAADRFYPSDDGITAWISFPSVERNKLTEESYIVLKKGHDRNLPVNASDNKYKILDISNEAPVEIKERRQLAFAGAVGFGDSLTSYPAGGAQTTKLEGFTPVVNTSVFVIARENTADGISDNLKDLLVAGNYIKFSRGTYGSNKYKIIQVRFTNTAGDIAQIYLNRGFESDINFLYDSDNTTVSNPETNNLQIFQTSDVENAPELNGFFFAKIEKNATLYDNVLYSATEVAVDSSTFPAFTGIASPNTNGDIIDDSFAYSLDSVGPEYETIQIWGGGHSPRRGYDKYYYNGGLLGRQAGGTVNIPVNGAYVPEWADVGADVEWDIVFDYLNEGSTAWSYTPKSFIEKLKLPGTRIKFSNHNTVYTITQTGIFDVLYNAMQTGDISIDTRIYVKLDKDLKQTVNPNFLADDIGVSIMGYEELDAITSSSNPAVFETEPKELADLNIYYEASDAFPIC